MGIVSSKFIKSDSKPLKVNTAVQTDIPKETTVIQDVRSPTADIIRTPIIVEKLKFDINYSGEYKLLPLRNKLLKSLKMDPRSPTIGIYRTPILIEDTPSSTDADNCTSPTSIYSCNMNDSVMEDLMTPTESSMNVSGFVVPKEMSCGEIDVTVECGKVAEKEENESGLKVSDKPNTYEAKKLLEEIKSDEENFLKKVKIPVKRGKKPAKNNEKNVDTRGKSRPPLFNITSSTNSPSNINLGIKHHSKNKVLPEYGFENSVISNTKHMVQWDQNNTVVI